MGKITASNVAITAVAAVTAWALVSIAQGLWKRFRIRGAKSPALGDMVFRDQDPEASSIRIALVALGRMDIDPGQCSAIRMTGGLTNLLYRVDFPADARLDPLLVRRFGAEAFLNRSVEDQLFAALSAAKIAPPYHGRFVNGRIEGFLVDWIGASLDDLADPAFSQMVAREQAKLHKFDPPQGLIPRASQTAKNMFHWLQMAAEVQLPLGSVEHKEYLKLDFVDLKARLRVVVDDMPTNSPLVFIHSDILFSNIMIHKHSGAVRLIDFEFASYNYRGLDIAAHFNEWAGGTEDGRLGRPDYSRFPSAAQQRNFCSAYLAEYHGTEPTSKEIEALVLEVRMFVQLQLFAGAFWAIVTAEAEGCQEFPYVTYALNRLERQSALAGRSGA